MEIGVVLLLAVAAHTGGVLWYAQQIGYDVLPSTAELGVFGLLWIYSGLVLKVLVPGVLYTEFGVLSPIILFLFSLGAALYDERTGSAGDTLGVVYLNMWPLYVVLFLTTGAIEYALTAIL